MNRDRQPAGAVFQMVLAMCILGSVGLMIKAIPMPSSAIAAVRGVVGVLALAAIARVKGHRVDRTAIRENRRVLLVSGIALGINWICSFAAYQYADVSIVTLCLYIYPVFMILFSPLLFQERLTPVRVLCMIVCMGGMFLSSGVLTQTLTEKTRYGILLAILAALFAAAVLLSVKLLDQVDALDITLVQLGIATALLWPYTLLTGAFQIARLNAGRVLLLLVAGVLHTGIAYYMQFSAVKRLKSQISAMLSYVDPLVALLLSMMILGERLDALQLFGAALILGATLVNQLFPTAATDKPSKVSPQK